MISRRSGNNAMCLLFFSSSYLGNPENLRLATENAKKKRYKLHSFIAFLILCPVVSGAWLLPFFSGIQHGLYGGNDNSDFPIGQFICQSVKLSAQRSFPICRIPKKKLIHGDMISKKIWRLGCCPLFSILAR